MTSLDANLNEAREDGAREIAALREEASRMRVALADKESALEEARENLAKQSAAEAERAAASEAEAEELRAALKSARDDLAVAEAAAGEGAASARVEVEAARAESEKLALPSRPRSKIPRELWDKTPAKKRAHACAVDLRVTLRFPETRRRQRQRYWGEEGGGGGASVCAPRGFAVH